MAEPVDTSYADPAESGRALAALGDADLLRLKRFAQYRAAGLGGLEWEDLFHEAIDKTLAGRRRWPRDVPFVVFLQQTIRSLAHEHWRRQLAGPTLSEADLDAGQAWTHDNAADDPQRSPEAQAEARDLLKAIYALFSGDALVLAVLDGLAEGLSAIEIMREAQCDAVAFASARRRIRRTLERATADGRLPNDQL